jgi:hypothetical protein
LDSWVLVGVRFFLELKALAKARVAMQAEEARLVPAILHKRVRIDPA